MTTTAVDTAGLDRAVADLGGHAASWAATTLAERITLLEAMLPRIVDGAEALVADLAEAKGYGAGSPWSGEDWIAGPWALAQNVGALLHVLHRVAAGKDPVPAKAVRERGGRAVVDVFPATGWEALLLNGTTAEVWTRPGTTARQVVERAAGPYRGRPGRPGVGLVLGAGNVAAITALDILHLLYTEDRAVVAKMNPVNGYVRPHFERVFSDFVDRGWVRFVDGGAAEGTYLAHHPEVDSVHVTGSGRTHDALVWGTDAFADERRRDDVPLLGKPFSSELGGISPCIVVPGKWSRADFRFQAEHIVTSKLNNSGHNCIASQILVLPDDWEGTELLLDAIRAVLQDLPRRSDYYPGSDARIGAVLEAHPDAEINGGLACHVLVPDVPAAGDLLLTEEVFGSVLGVVRLPGTIPTEFLDNAVAFANDVLPGNLGATLIVHPKTEMANRAAVERAVAELRYGTIGVNCWSAIGFLLGYTPWGAYPGNTRQDIGSGIGFVHNAFMLEDVEKTVLRAPFAPMPRGLLTGSPSISPKPAYFVTNRTTRTTIRGVTRFTARPSILKLPAIFGSALRG